MKTTRILVVLFFGLFFQAALFAQTVTFMVVSKSHAYTQTDNTTVADATNPWQFEAHVEGTNNTTDLSGIATPTLALPGGSTGSNTLTYNSQDNAWRVKASFADSSGSTLLDGAYGSGNYSLTALGQTVTPISLTGDTYPAAPIASLSGGTIVGGVLTWNVSQALTITITGTADHMGISVGGNSYNDSTESFGVGTISFTIPATSMLAGNSYTVNLDFDDIVGGTNVFTVGSGALMNANYAGVYNSDTTFTIQAIPEPSTYAAILGAIALAGVMIHRRRRQTV